MKKGLFINNKKAKDSIYESGYMVYKCLCRSQKYQWDYREIDLQDREIKPGYDFYFFNYHPITMGWLQTRNLKEQLGLVGTMILEVAPGDAFVFCPRGDFHFYCALDPTIKSKQSNLYAFPRPLEELDIELPEAKKGTPLIGSFGFATRGKGFHHVVDAVNREFDKATVRINIPYGDFVPDSERYASFLGDLCKQRAKPGIDVVISHDFMGKEELIKWCATNTLNCFLYDRNMPGLSATTDQAIVSGRPLAVAANDTFRHITAYLAPYPSFSLQDSIAQSGPLVRQMRADWQPEKFMEKFDRILKSYLDLNRTKKSSPANYILPTTDLIDTIAKRLKKYRRKIGNVSLTGLFKAKSKNEVI